MSTDTHNTPNLVDRIRMSRARLDTLHRLESEVARLDRAAETAAAESDHARLLTLLGALLFDALEAGPARTRTLLGELAPAAFPSATTPPPRERPSSDPAPARATAKEATRPEIDAAMLAKLQDKLRANQGGGDEAEGITFVPAAPMSEVQKRYLQGILDALGPIPSNLRGARPARREIERLEDVVTRTLADWTGLDDATHREVLAFVVARLRALQTAVDKHLTGAPRGDLAEAVNTLIRRLTLHSATARPGSTHGLAARHKPMTGDWTSDAERAMKALLSRLSVVSLKTDAHITPAGPKAPRPSAAAADDAVRRLRGELQDGLEGAQFIGALWLLIHEHGLAQRDPRVVGLARAALGDDPGGLLAGAGLADVAREVQKDADDGAPEPSAPWPYRELTKGLRAVIVGGDRRPERETAIQRDLGLQSLRWVATDTGFRHVDALTDSIAAGSVDLVIVLQRFVSHSITDRLFALRSERCRVVLATSYGVRAVREGLERFMGVPVADGSEKPKTA